MHFVIVKMKARENKGQIGGRFCGFVISQALNSTLTFIKHLQSIYCVASMIVSTRTTKRNAVKFVPQGANPVIKGM